MASLEGHVDVVKLLLEKGADVEVKDNVRRTPLLHAAINRNKATIKLLLATDRVNVNLIDYYDSIPLSVAVRIGYKNEVIFLLTKSYVLNI
jgi:ankyrin repeat protein